MEGGRLKENSGKLREQILPSLDSYYLKLREGLTFDYEKAIVSHQDTCSKVRIEIAKVEEHVESENLTISNLTEQVEFLEKINVKLAETLTSLQTTKNVPVPKQPDSQMTNEANPIIKKQLEIITELHKAESFYEKKLGMRITRNESVLRIEFDFIGKDRGVHVVELFLDPRTDDFVVKSTKPSLPKSADLVQELNLTKNLRKFVAKIRKAFCELYQ